MHIVIADDHPVFRSGLIFLLNNSFENIKIDQFDNGGDVAEFVALRQPDICILDIDMPVRSGLDVCQDIREKNQQTKIIVLTFHQDIEMLKLAMYKGANAFLMKDNTSEEIVDCIATVLEGKSYIPKKFIEENRLLEETHSIKGDIDLLKTLTKTEIKTLKLVSQKYTSKEISNLLFVSEKTIENYRSRICKKLNLDARNNSLVMWVMENKVLIDNIKDLI